MSMPLSVKIIILCIIKKKKKQQLYYYINYICIFLRLKHMKLYECQRMFCYELYKGP